MSGLWAKLNLRDQREIAVLNAPDSFAAELKALGRIRVHRRISGVKELTFVLTFVVTKVELDNGAAPVRWTVYRLRFLISSPSILHPKRSLPPQAAEIPGGFFLQSAQKSTAYKGPGAEISLDPWPRYPRKFHVATILHS